MAVGDVFALQFQQTIQARKVTNNLGYIQTAGADNANVAQFLADGFVADVVPTWLNVVTTEVQANCVYTRRVAPNISVPYEATLTNQAGTLAAPTYPNNAPALLVLQTDSNSSKDNGMFFLSGLQDAIVINGALDLIFIANGLNPLRDLLLAPLEAPGANDQVYQLAVIDRVDQLVPIIPPVANTVIAGTWDLEIMNQVRRTTKRTASGIAPPP